MSIKKAKRGLRPGGTGLGVDHLKTLANNSSVGPSDLCRRLAKLATIVASGKVCAEVGEWFAAAPLIPLKKPDNSVRPIAIGETLRRLVGRLLMYRAKSDGSRITSANSTRNMDRLAGGSIGSIDARDCGGKRSVGCACLNEARL